MKEFKCFGREEPIGWHIEKLASALGLQHNAIERYPWNVDGKEGTTYISEVKDNSGKKIMDVRQVFVISKENYPQKDLENYTKITEHLVRTNVSYSTEALELLKKAEEAMKNQNLD
jgi:hypothetical protein